MQLYRNGGKYWPVDCKFLVVVHQYDGDISWAKELKFPHIIYEKNKPGLEPFNALNKGKGETNFLKFLAQFYDDLPPNIIQVYQYNEKFYHTGTLVSILNDPDFEKKYLSSKTKGFYNFNNIILGSILGNPRDRMVESGWWGTTMRPYFGEITEWGNFTMGRKGCAQFVVSRDLVRSLPREFYENMYIWIVSNTLDRAPAGMHLATKTRLSTPDDNESLSDYYTSRYMEWSWELIFTSYKPDGEETMIVGKVEAVEGKEVVDGRVEKVEGKIEGKAEAIEKVEKGRAEKVKALYGSMRYYVDVTHLLPSSGIITKEMVFNDMFGDVLFGSAKELIISRGMNIRVFPEGRKEDISIVNDHKTRALYGAPNNWVDVTHLLPASGIITKEMVFNTLFGDHLPGTWKKLVITHGESIRTYSEYGRTDINITEK